MAIRDLSGKVFNRLTVLSYYERVNGRIYWLCQCSCGSPPKLIRGDHITSDHTQSCGCYDKETSIISGKICTNGAQSENVDPLLKSTYKSWLKMKARCDNPNDGEYKRYGERGISYCSDWSKFENFLRDLGVKPDKDLTLERHNVNGNYCKDNCSWGSKSQQAHNQRKVKHTKIYSNKLKELKELKRLGATEVTLTPEDEKFLDLSIDSLR